MDPTAVAALTKLVVGASGSLGSKLTALAWSSATRDRRGLSHPELRIDLQRLENELLATSLTDHALTSPLGTIYEFITSPVMKTFTEQLVLVAFAGARPTLEKALREELRASLSAYIAESAQRHSLSNDADAIFATVSELTGAAVTALRDNGYRLADDALQRLHNLTLELYASSIERNTRLLSGLQPQGLERHEAFLHRLKDQVAFRYRHIEPPDFERIVRIPIERLYVTPNLSEGSEPHPHAQGKLDLGNFASRIYRTVVLGDPGGGKSTLSAFLAHAIGEGTFAQDSFSTKTPMVITVRDIQLSGHGAESILQHLQTLCDTAYALRPQATAIDYGLLNGRFFLVFDGLDELLDPTQRGEVVHAIESVANLYPSTPIMVTSRRINYDAAPLDPDLFQAYSLNEFDNRRINDYASKYFAQLDDKSKVEQGRLARAFLRESRDHAAEISSNPLVLALLCRLYRSEGYIPQNIPSLYQRCANMLFFTWDARRHITPDLPFEYHIEPLMSHLAYWVFESGQPAVNETAVISHAKSYLQEWLIRDPHEADSIATAFVQYFRNRLWIFTEVGLTEEGERLYAFTHRTFLEYFAGVHVSTNAASSIALAEELLPQLTSTQWEIVAQVAIYLRSKAEVRAADEIIGRFLKAAQADQDSRGGLLSFIDRLLAFVVPRPETLYSIVHATLDYIVQLTRSGDTTSLWSILINMARARVDNRAGITRSIESYVTELIAGPRTDALMTVSVLLELPEVLQSNVVGDTGYMAELVSFWRTMAVSISSISGQTIREWAAEDDALALTAWRLGVVTIDEIWGLHGALPVLASVLSDVTHPSRDAIPRLEAFYDSAIARPTPWFRLGWLGTPELSAVMFYDLADSKKAFSAVLFVMAASYENINGRRVLKTRSLGDLDGFKDVFAARGEVQSDRDPREWLESFADLATEDCMDILADWLATQLSFCADIGDDEDGIPAVPWREARKDPADDR